jgi:PAS domain S-box-containing protein
MFTRIKFLSKFLPRRLTTRIMSGMILIVVSAGMVTTLAINQILARSLGQELSNSGYSITISLGENIADALIDGNLVSLQESLNNALTSNPDIVYAFAYGPHTPIVHTFPGGFPRDLLYVLDTSRPETGSGLLLETERGPVRDFVYRPLDGINAEIHVGISENRVQAEQWRVTKLVLLLTVVGCLLAAGITYAISRLTTYPLVEFTRRVRRLGQGQLDERFAIQSGDEIGELAQAFNAMADAIQGAIQRLRTSEAGYRTLLTAAGDVGEGIALIAEAHNDEGRLLFVNDAFAHLVGFEVQDLIGVSVSSVLHPDSIEPARQSWQAIRLGTKQSVPAELTLMDRRGNHRIVETASTMIEYQNEQALVWFTRDITDRKRREQELHIRNKELAALNTVASALNEPYSSDFLHHALHVSLEALELEIGWVTLLRPDGKGEVVAQEGIDIQPLITEFPACFCGGVLHTGQPMLLDVKEHCTLNSYLLTSGSKRLQHATVPLGRGEKIFGVLSVAFAAPRNFDEHNFSLLSSIGKSLGIALENSRLWDELQQKEQLRSELLARAIHAQEEERQRIARELHDATGQSINAIVFGLNALKTSLEKSPEQTFDLLDKLSLSASDTVRELQTIIYDLRPSLLDDLGLIPALRWYAQERLETQNVKINLEIHGSQQRLSSQVETTLFRIGQEAITNISKYAQAHQVDISIYFSEAQTCIEIADDGIGFDPQHILQQSSHQGLGLLGMRERAALMGGSLELESFPGRGTRLKIALPTGVVQ